MDVEVTKSGTHTRNRRLAVWDSWSSWSSPVGLGIFLLTGTLALAILFYTLLSLFGAISEATHPASSGVSQQQLEQELEQASPQQTPASATTDSTGAATQ